MTKVFLDANILYPNTVRSLFIWLHKSGTVEIFWSMGVWEEAFTVFSRSHNDIESARFRSVITEKVIAGYPECLVADLSQPTFLGLKDKNDEHVVAAAASCNADYLISDDGVLLGEDLSKTSLIALKPDDLMIKLVSESPQSVVRSVHDHIENLPKTRPSIATYLQSLRNSGLTKFAGWSEQRQKSKKLFSEVW